MLYPHPDCMDSLNPSSCDLRWIGAILAGAGTWATAIGQTAG